MILYFLLCAVQAAEQKLTVVKYKGRNVFYNASTAAVADGEAKAKEYIEKLGKTGINIDLGANTRKGGFSISKAQTLDDGVLVVYSDGAKKYRAFIDHKNISTVSPSDLAYFQNLLDNGKTIGDEYFNEAKEAFVKAAVDQKTQLIADEKEESQERQAIQALKERQQQQVIQALKEQQQQDAEVLSQIAIQRQIFITSSDSMESPKDKAKLVLYFNKLIEKKKLGLCLGVFKILNDRSNLNKKVSVFLSDINSELRTNGCKTLKIEENSFSSNVLREDSNSTGTAIWGVEAIK